MIMRLGMEHYEPKLYTVYINDDLELTLTYFTTMSNFAKLVFCTYSRPRYQVSVYRTIGPLVLFCIQAYILTYKLEPNGQRHQIQVSPNKLGYYLQTYTTHPGRRYTVTVAAVTQKVRGPESDPVTVRSGEDCVKY